MSKIFYLKTTICMGIALFLAGCVMTQQTYTPSSYVSAEDTIAENMGIPKLVKEFKERREKALQQEDWSPEIKRKIRNGEIAIGMTEEQAGFSWTLFRKVNRSVGSWGVHEQWVYEPSKWNNYRRGYLYFENGILTSYSD